MRICSERWRNDWYARIPSEDRRNQGRLTSSNRNNRSFTFFPSLSLSPPSFPFLSFLFSTFPFSNTLDFPFSLSAEIIERDDIGRVNLFSLGLVDHECRGTALPADSNTGEIFLERGRSLLRRCQISWREG